MQFRAALTLVLLAALLGCSRESAAQPALRAEVYASGLSVPVAFLQDPTDRAVQFVVEQSGRIRVVRSGVVLSAPFLDLTTQIAFGGERGLLGMALAPDYPASGRFYVNFTDSAGNTVVARFRRSTNPLVADPSSRFDLRWNGAGGPAFIAQPFANHNGGHLAFGPDGFLYVGLGDGGAGGDPGHRAQNPGELLGKMLRIDVNVPDADAIGYMVPSSNPFVGAGGTRPEIWSFGLRNPWRYCFDDPARGGTGALLIGDVGQGLWEEIDYEPAGRGGRNYGWRLREGAHDFDASLPPAFLPLVDPVHEYDHVTGQSVTGGCVYRGLALGPSYRGRYFFADFVRGRVWSTALTSDPGGEGRVSNLIEHTAELGAIGGPIGNVSAFGVDADGELYIVSYSRGRIYRVLGAPVMRGDLDADFDGDGRSDIAVYRPSNGVWFILRSSSNYLSSAVYQWGLSGDVPVRGDYDGDGRSEIAVYRPANGTWYILLSSTNYGNSVAYQVGSTGDIPVPGDYDGDGRTDVAVYRPSIGAWIVLRSSTNFGSAAVYLWGLAGDVPMPGDYDGDGRTDVVAYRPSTGMWFVLTSGSEYTAFFTALWGLPSDLPVSGDFDGDGRIDITAYRPSTGIWYVLRSSSGYTTFDAYHWGISTDVPLRGDFDGDGRSDIVVYRPSGGLWWVLGSQSGYTSFSTYHWGLDGDAP